MGDVRGAPLGREERACLENRQHLPGRITEADLVERILAGLRERELDSEVRVLMRKRGNTGAHRGDRGRGEAVLVQADEEAPVGEDAVGMRPGVAGAALRESQRLVELHGRADVAGRDADFEELAEHQSGGDAGSDGTA